MASYFLDTSALVKRQITEPGHAWVHALCVDDLTAGRPVATFVCADVNLLAAAQVEGFTVEDPTAHP